MASSVFELVGELNKVFAYYTLDQDSITNCGYFSMHLETSNNHVETTSSFLTVKTLIHLFEATRGEKINELSDNCVVELECKNICSPRYECKEIYSPRYTFLYSGGYMYHSYSAEYSLKRVKIDKSDISEMLSKFSNFPNSNTWEKLTGVRIPNFTRKYDITITNLTNCDPSQIKTNAIILINNALQALATGKGEHQDDFYVLIFSYQRSSNDDIGNGIKYLNDLLSKII